MMFSAVGHVQVEGSPVKVQLLDTAGQVRLTTRSLKNPLLFFKSVISYVFPAQYKLRVPKLMFHHEVPSRLS